MSRSQRLTIDDAVTHAAEPGQRGIARFIEAEDARLDEERRAELRTIDAARAIAERTALDPDGRDSFEHAIVATVLGWATEHARLDPEDVTRVKRVGGGKRPARDKSVRFRDEIDALRSWWSSNATSRAGDTERALAKGRLGAVQSVAVRAEPSEDPHIAAVGRALASLTDAQALLWAYVEVAGPRQTRLTTPLMVPRRIGELFARNDSSNDRSAAEKYGALRSWQAARAKGATSAGDTDLVMLPAGTPIAMPTLSESAMAIAFDVRENNGPLPAWSKLRRSPALRWEHLVAERLGMPIGDGDGGGRDGDGATPGPGADVCGAPGDAVVADRATDGELPLETPLDRSARLVGRLVSAARKELRRRLHVVDLDVAVRYVIPRPAEREQSGYDREGPQSRVRCCSGPATRGGVRLPCRPAEVEGPAGVRHRAAAAARCGACGLPVVPAPGQ